MSCNEWEAGKIKIPPSQWVRFKKSIRDAYNDFMDKELSAATVFWNEFKNGKLPKFTEFWGEERNRYNRWIDGKRRFHKIFLNKKEGTIRNRPRKPFRYEFSHVTNREESIELGDAAIFFNNKTHIVTWEVYENNHACDHARKHEVGRAFFSALKKIEWSRGSGGEIVGNDEYNQESRYDGGGANYTKYRYGNLKDLFAHNERI